MNTPMPVEDLAAALRAGARDYGDWDRIAAVELLVGHESWLYREDFRRHVTIEADGTARVNLRNLAGWVDGARASSSEAAVLRLACSLAGHHPNSADLAERWALPDRWSLREILRPLGRVNTALAVEAVRYAALGPTGGGR